MSHGFKWYLLSMRTSLRRVERPTYGFEISLLIVVNFNIGADVVGREIPRVTDSIPSPCIFFPKT